MSKPKLYKSYLFRDKDPVIDELRTLVQKANGSRDITHKHLENISESGGPSAACMSEWFFGKTKRPTNATIEACGRALGFKREWVRATKTKK